MAALYGNAVVGQSGGPTAAINATLAGVIRGVLDNRDVIHTLYGMRNGVEGLLSERLVDLTELVCDEETIETLENTPAAALGSCRYRLPKPKDDSSVFDKLLAIFKKYDIRYFFYIGGNDSMDAVAKLTEYLEDKEYEMRVIGVPKTIDNDLVGTDHTPGFGSAAKYIATTVSEVVRDCSVYTVKAVTIVEIMGRDAGWLTASASLASLANAAPDLIYLPERPFSEEAFLASIEKAFLKHPNIVVAVSEGLRTEDGEYVGASAQSGVADAFGHKYLSGTGKYLERLVKEKLGCKVRSIELNLPQRCAAHLASATDIEESVLTGKTAVLSAIGGTSGHMMIAVREDNPYRITVSSAPVKEIANAVKSVPDAYINEEGNGITDEGIRYLAPLILGERRPVYLNGIPKHFVIE